MPTTKDQWIDKAEGRYNKKIGRVEDKLYKVAVDCLKAYATPLSTHCGRSHRKDMRKIIKAIEADKDVNRIDHVLGKIEAYMNDDNNNVKIDGDLDNLYHALVDLCNKHPVTDKLGCHYDGSSLPRINPPPRNVGNSY